MQLTRVFFVGDSSAKISSKPDVSFPLLFFVVVKMEPKKPLRDKRPTRFFSDLTGLREP
jgi:hypothetical protein